MVKVFWVVLFLVAATSCSARQFADCEITDEDRGELQALLGRIENGNDYD